MPFHTPYTPMLLYSYRPEYLHSLSVPVHLWYPLMAANPPDGSLMSPWHPYTPSNPWCHLHPYWPSTYTPASPQCTPDNLHSLMDPHAPDTPTPPRSPQCPLMLPMSLLVPEGIHWLPAPNAPLPAPWHPLTPPTPLLVEAFSGQQWYYCRSAWHPTVNCYIWQTFYPWG